VVEVEVVMELVNVQNSMELQVDLVEVLVKLELQ
jgi:hypothetical protein